MAVVTGFAGRAGRWAVGALLAAGGGLVALPATGLAPAEGVHSVQGQAHEAPGLAAGQRFWVHDRHRYASRWFAGRHRRMVPFGCTAAPYYAPSPRCSGDRGFHHGLDIAMGCGTKLYAGLRGTVVRPDAPGSLGSAYGPYAFRLRNRRLDQDFVIGHVLQVYVSPGDHVARGELIARASDQGAPDGCHLHFEVRPSGGSYEEAVNPRRALHLSR